MECPTPVPPGDFAFFGDDQAVEVNFAQICPEVEFPTLHEIYVTDKFMAGVYRPDVGGDWPNQDFPLLVFAHGNGHRYYGYDALFSELTRLGIVVISLDFADNLDVATRGEQLLCASRWFSSMWTEANRLDGSLMYAGHSRGGEAVAYAVGLRNSLNSPLDLFELRANLSIAPSTFLSGLALLSLGAPFFIIQGSTDEDTTHGANILYDNIGIEQNAPPGLPGKWMAWLYDIRHNDYGGKCSAPPPMKTCLSTPKGRAAVRNYFSSFLQWHQFGQSSFRQFFIGSDDDLPNAPDSLSESEFWTEWGMPRIFRSWVEDTDKLAGERRVLDAFEDGNLQMSTANGAVAFAGDLTVLLEGAANQNVENTVSDTGVLYLRWDSDGQPVVRWSVPETLRQGIGSFSHFQFRIANVINSIGPMPSCEIESNPPPSFEVSFIDSANNVFSFSSTSAGEIPVQDSREVVDALQIASCAGTNFLRTLRMPLDRLCALGLELTELAFVEYRFDATAPGHVMLDSLEFTRSPFDDPGACGPPLVCM